MINLNEKVTTNINVRAEQIANLLDAICPYQDKTNDLTEALSLTFSENETGWFFECKVCQGARCTGFLRND
jgi:hypothetical protein